MFTIKTAEVSERPSLLSRLPGPKRAVWPSSSLKPDHTILHRKLEAAVQRAVATCRLYYSAWIDPMAHWAHPHSLSELGRTEHWEVRDDGWGRSMGWKWDAAPA